MSKGKRGRPTKHNNIVSVNDLYVEFLSKKRKCLRHVLLLQSC